MGQGAEDAGGYEIDYDPAEEGLATGRWKNEIPVHQMTTRHLRNALRNAEDLSECATFSCDSDKWSTWADILRDELYSRTSRPSNKPTQSKPKKPVRGKKQRMKCHCGTEYEARVADLNRGNALSCSKRCAAIRREFGRPPAKKIVDPN